MKLRKTKLEEVAKLKNTDEEEYNAIMKKKLFFAGLKCMIVSNVILLLCNWSYVIMDGIAINILYKFFEMMKIFSVIGFVVGSIAYLMSFIYTGEQSMFG